jgi:hypothetical protein
LKRCVEQHHFDGRPLLAQPKLPHNHHLHAPPYVNGIRRRHHLWDEWICALPVALRVTCRYTRSMDLASLQLTVLDRMVLAVERVRDRLVRATAALNAAGVLYAVAGGNAVAAWVATIDTAAVRNTQDVDILLRRADLDAAARALEAVGFVRRHVAGIDIFLDGPDAKARDAVHVVIAQEKVRPEYDAPAPDVTEFEQQDQFKVLALESLVRMKLTSFRDKDRTHLRDMLDVGLIDDTWPSRFTPELAQRLQHLIDTPDQ